MDNLDNGNTLIIVAIGTSSHRLMPQSVSFRWNALRDLSHLDVLSDADTIGLVH